MNLEEPSPPQSSQPLASAMERTQISPDPEILSEVSGAPKGKGSLGGGPTPIMIDESTGRATRTSWLPGETVLIDYPPSYPEEPSRLLYIGSARHLVREENEAQVIQYYPPPLMDFSGNGSSDNDSIPFSRLEICLCILIHVAIFYGAPPVTDAESAVLGKISSIAISSGPILSASGLFLWAAVTILSRRRSIPSALVTRDESFGDFDHLQITIPFFLFASGVMVGTAGLILCYISLSHLAAAFVLAVFAPLCIVFWFTNVVDRILLYFRISRARGRSGIRIGA
ncbi:hypothetical protein SISSUDRAFT_1051322 [Sistotremastrum suecicum HHB10207 ss-3]|uniref:Uncharacterized protein n=1 Tax=Sistotremastrum suecicum HHB10207 ss-3 TaxID=1314776 RepID=A0A166ANL9_9AGAM|nr:hypothetical protein SISSUDRAFT_1051322 [Sistotremastrum suecicum HHB10207 ss-3]